MARSSRQLSLLIQAFEAETGLSRRQCQRHAKQGTERWEEFMKSRALGSVGSAGGGGNLREQVEAEETEAAEAKKDERKALEQQMEIALPEELALDGTVASIDQLRAATAASYRDYVEAKKSKHTDMIRLYHEMWQKNSRELRIAEKDDPKIRAEQGLYLYRPDVTEEIKQVFLSVNGTFKRVFRWCREHGVELAEMSDADGLDWEKRTLDRIFGALKEAEFASEVDVEGLMRPPGEQEQSAEEAA